MATPMATEGAPSLPPPIIRSSSLSPGRMGAPMPSPRFDQAVDSHHKQQHAPPGSPALLSPSPAPPTSSILLNKPSSPLPVDGEQQQQHGLGLRVASPDGSTTGTGTSTPATAISTTSPPPQAAVAHSSPVARGAASYFAQEQQHSAEAIGRPSRSPSPHCHFAPLPKVEGERPGTRRNSTAQGGAGRVKPYVGGAGQTSDDSPFANTDSLDSTKLASTLSSLNLHRRNSNTSSPSAPASRSRHASRSTSPSPSRRPPPPPQPQMASNASSRSHSPAMSRRASTDAMSLHYIEGARSRTESRERGAAAGAGGLDKERELEFERVRMVRDKEREGLGWKEEQAAAAAAGRLSPPAVGAAAGASNSVEHSEGVSRTESPALGEQPPQQRKPMFVEPPASEKERPKTVRRRSNEEVVEIEPGEEKGGVVDDLEDLDEEEEDEEGRDGEGSDEVEEDAEDDEDEDEEAGERSRDEDDDEEVEEEAVPRATSRGAAVEVVHWHRPESSAERERE